MFNSRASCNWCVAGSLELALPCLEIRSSNGLRVEEVVLAASGYFRVTGFVCFMAVSVILLRFIGSGVG
jgi:hypothetical protein